ncbi:MAG: FliM/FliN family flagellar motor switch protein [Pseudomonadota bacterium]
MSEAPESTARDRPVSILARLAARGRRDTGAAMTLQKALRVALAKAGDACLGVDVTLTDVVQGVLLPDQLQAALPDAALIVELDGPGKALALAVLCPQSVAAVIEAQTLGRVTQGAATPRRATSTDATMARAFLEDTLAKFADLAMGHTGLPMLEGYCAGTRLSDARVASLMLEDASHMHLEMTLNYASAAKTGALHLVMPPRGAAKAEDKPSEEEFRAKLEQALLDVKIPITAEIARLEMSMDRVAALAVGDEISLAGVTLDSAVIRTSDDQIRFRGRLGRYGVHPSIKIHPPNWSSAPEDKDGASTAADLSPPDPSGSNMLPVAPAAAPLAKPAPASPPDLPNALSDDGGLAESEPAAMTDMSDLPEMPALQDLSDLPDLAAVPTPAPGVSPMQAGGGSPTQAGGVSPMPAAGVAPKPAAGALSIPTEGAAPLPATGAPFLPTEASSDDSLPELPDLVPVQPPD